MERIDSQSKSRRIEDALAQGHASECIGKKCVCWRHCSYEGKVKPSVCMFDLSTGFYRKYEGAKCVGTEYRDPLRTGKSGVFNKKKKRH